MPVLQHGLETLKLSPLHLEDHIPLAGCIDRVFPKLVVLSISGSAQFMKSGVEKEIQEIYEGLQSARKDLKNERPKITLTKGDHNLYLHFNIYHLAA